jgi:hypothetical protein
MTDDRFVHLMDRGHELFYLRLSQFRDQVGRMLSGDSPATETEVDDCLYDIGRYVLQSAWHEDQRLAVLTATHLCLPGFRNAIELLYLCLSADLCELRSAVDDRMLRFFEIPYPQPAIREFLSLLGRLDGGVLNEIPRSALRLYGGLAREFAAFVKTEVEWGLRQTRFPLFKLLYGNLPRLAAVGNVLREDTRVREAAESLEDKAQSVIAELSIGVAE